MIKNLNRQECIVRLIKNNPGINFRDIMRHTGMKNGVLSHYLSKIEKSGTVAVNRQPRQTRYYPLELSHIESKIAESLRRETPRKIIHFLMLHKDGLEFTELVQSVKKAPSTISLYLSQLTEYNIVKVILHGRKKRYCVENVQAVDKLIERYHPGMLDKPVTSMEDIFNSL